MKCSSKRIAAIWQDESGISSVEYALLLAFVATGIILAADALSDAVSGAMQEAADCLNNGSAGSGAC